MLTIKSRVFTITYKVLYQLDFLTLFLTVFILTYSVLGNWYTPCSLNIVRKSQHQEIVGFLPLLWSTCLPANHMFCILPSGLCSDIISSVGPFMIPLSEVIHRFTLCILLFNAGPLFFLEILALWNFSFHSTLKAKFPVYKGSLIFDWGEFSDSLPVIAQRLVLSA